MKELFASLRHVFSDDAGHVRKKVVGLYLVLISFNVVAWVWAIIAFRDHPVLLGAAVLAYTFGLRHAFDADHIASIDSVTRKLMQQNKRPITIGLHFSIGHSLALVVFVTMIALFASSNTFQSEAGFVDSTAGIVSTFVSVSFLLIMAVLNLTIARSTYLSFRKVRNGGVYVEEDFDMLLNKRGFLSRIFRPLFKFVTKSWHMVFIGFLFGLGFDTATEVTLLGIAGAEAAKGLSVWVIMAFPALFAAGMSLMDTTDSILMVGAYGWAFRKPIRKLYYNLTITVISAMVAIIVAGIEGLGFLGAQLKFKGQVWDTLNGISNHWGITGVIIVSLFIASWLISTLVYRVKRYEELDIETT
ncbi:MAG: HoxN/HupN/NixA family nickel/cobalt transporter [Gammaproteobacteria bacterium]